MNELKSILVHLDDSAACAERLQVAVGLAQSQGAALKTLYAVLSASALYPYTFGAEAPLAAQMAALQEERKIRQRRAFEALQRTAAEVGKIAWDETNEDPVRGFVRHAWAADLLLLGQPESQSSTFGGVDDNFVPSVLIDSGKPALVLPYIHQGPVNPQKILLAWKPSAPAARAIAAALPFLVRARHVHLATWQEESDSDDSALQVASGLRTHGVGCTMHRETPDKAGAGELMLSLAADLQADLLVMGCYGHSRTREWLLGGASRTVLRSMTLPVLMAH